MFLPAMLMMLPATGSAAGLFTTDVTLTVISGEKAKITIHPDTNYQHMTLTLTREEDDKTLTLVRKNVRKNKDFNFEWSVEDGSWTYSGSIDASWNSDEEFLVPMDFMLVVAAPLKIEVPRPKIDIKEKKVVALIDRDAARGTVELIGLDGVFETIEEDFTYYSAGEELAFSWTSMSEVIKMVVKVWDVHGFMAFEEITPWSLSIPHDDVIFETGSHEIRDSEVPKLHKAAKTVQETIERYGHIVQIRLYIAGYTDTVGPAADNVGLSQRRAKAIATWFRSAGFKVPTYYQGFGEDALAVNTDDNIDMAVNRRALYLLAAHHPHGKELPRSNWQKLP